MPETVEGALLFDPGAMSIKQFCADNDISEAYYFVLRKRGEGPDEMRIGRSVRISREARARWRRQRETSINKIGA
jgi:hypothetical protein